MTYEEFYKVVKAAYENKDYFAEEITTTVGCALKDVEAAQKKACKHPVFRLALKCEHCGEYAEFPTTTTQ